MPDVAKPLSDAFDLPGLINGLAADLKALRAGEISVRDARARADLAKQILRGVHYVVLAQRYIAANAKEVPALPASPRKRGSR